MKRFLICLLLLLPLAACHQAQPASPSPRAASQRILTRAETIWQQTTYYTSKAKATGALTTPTRHTATAGQTVTTHAGALGANRATTYAKLKATLTRTDKFSGTKTRPFTLAQLNAALKAAGAKVQLTSFKDLACFTHMSYGYLAVGHTLYGLPLSYAYGNQRDPTPTTADRVVVYRADIYQAPKRWLSDAAITGRWAAQDDRADQVVVTHGNLYRAERAGVTWSTYRVAIQSLKHIKAQTLYANLVFSNNQGLALSQNYAMPRATTRAGSDGTYLYLFLSASKLVRIGQGTVRTLTKISRDPTTTTPSAATIHLFELADAQGGDHYANVLSTDATGTTTVGMVDAINRLTENAIQQNTVIATFTLTDGQLTITRR
ncbi:hypothetical protein [Lacticaseibacillus daqingensis]|uniref:hypothetical protein n=1 Tax=Lacticaseibacillus daqingensis TaxID=2486014 RepID=UPI000F7787F3|nr:hypothetical protein [Lacticaseibacillus daqingensis]